MLQLRISKIVYSISVIVLAYDFYVYVYRRFEYFLTSEEKSVSVYFLQINHFIHLKMHLTISVWVVAIPVSIPLEGRELKYFYSFSHIHLRRKQ